VRDGKRSKVIARRVCNVWLQKRRRPPGPLHEKQEADLKRTTLFHLLIAAMLCLAAIPVSAQMAPHVPPPKARDRDHGNDAPISLTGQVQEQLDRLEGDLRITAAERPLWSAYADRVLRLADDIARARFITRSSDATDVPAPQQLERLADVARNRLAAVEDIVDAGKALYAGLAPDQKSTADRRLVAIALQLAASGTSPPDAAMLEGRRGH
jgi:hypothetical protein